MLVKEKYSLWLMPEDEIYDRLASVISQLSKPYATPKFEPHVTLVGGLTYDIHDILMRTSTLSSELQPYTIKLNEIGFKAEFFQCLFIHVIPTEPVMAAYEKTLALFDITKTIYMPHLSLMYGDISQDIKRSIISTIKQELIFSFRVSEIHVFQTSSDPITWQRIARFPLSGKQNSANRGKQGG